MTIKGARLLLFLACVAPQARASLNYPGIVENTWGVDALPVEGEGCLLCHTTEPGRAGTATRPFADTIRGRGVQGGNAAGLQRVLREIARDGDDSDDDGSSDYEEIFLGTNPNDPEDTPPEPNPTGQGGAAGASGAGGEGGEFEGSGPRVPPPPPPSVDLPPPLGHGCAASTVGANSGGAVVVTGALMLSALLRRTRRRRV